MMEDWKKLNWLKRILVIIDLILNPKAKDYPFLYCNKEDTYDFSNLKNHIIIKEYDEGDKHWILCLRWL